MGRAPTVRLPSPEIRRTCAPLLTDPPASAIVSDFDGTLSPIVPDPAEARPLGGTAQLLSRLAGKFGVVAVVSGRPVSFLIDQLDAAGHRRPVDAAHRPGEAPRAVRLVGLYGLEWSDEAGVITRAPGAEHWRSAVDGSLERLQLTAPRGVVVEGKGLAVTIHWRRAPEVEPWVTEAVASESERTGLRPHLGRMSIELRPALDIDKGSVVRGLVEGCSAACYLGDDLGDLPAFAALAELRTAGMATVSVAVADDESAPEVAAAADLTLAGPPEALGLLGWLADG
jgi:trehalose 6-phosphate phosphatase